MIASIVLVCLGGCTCCARGHGSSQSGVAAGTPQQGVVYNQGTTQIITDPKHPGTVQYLPAQGMFGQPAVGTYGPPPPGAYGQLAPGTYGQLLAGAYGQPAPGTYGQPLAGTYGQPAPGTYGQPAQQGTVVSYNEGSNMGAPPLAGYAPPPPPTAPQW